MAERNIDLGVKHGESTLVEGESDPLLEAYRRVINAHELIGQVQDAVNPHVRGLLDSAYLLHRFCVEALIATARTTPAIHTLGEIVHVSEGRRNSAHFIIPFAVKIDGNEFHAIEEREELTVQAGDTPIPVVRYWKSPDNDSVLPTILVPFGQDLSISRLPGDSRIDDGIKILRLPQEPSSNPTTIYAATFLG